MTLWDQDPDKIDTKSQTSSLRGVSQPRPGFTTTSLHFNGHFPGKARLAGFIEGKDDGSGGDNWSYKMRKAPVESLPPTNQHNRLRVRCPSNRQCQNYY